MNPDDRLIAELNAIHEIRLIVEDEPGKLMLDELVERVREMQRSVFEHRAVLESLAAWCEAARRAADAEAREG